MVNDIMGSVYLASTESELKKGWLKCGITTRNTKTRIAEGNVASIREKYELLFAIDTKFFKELEKYMHEKYENQKEWIKVSLPEAVAEINRYLKDRESGSVKHKKFKPKKHQKDAVGSVVKEFKKENKASIVMPTGSGKTLTSLWITEALKCEKVLFIAPSLQLIRQTKDSWVEQSNTDFVWMACCSANDIEEREHAIEMGGGMVSTNPQEIDGFMRFMNGKRVVFCTYQSLPSIIESGVEFDLTISDEAH